jgi:hypothetical protein
VSRALQLTAFLHATNFEPQLAAAAPDRRAGALNRKHSSALSQCANAFLVRRSFSVNTLTPITMNLLTVLEASTIVASIALSYASSKRFHSHSPDAYFDSDDQFSQPVKGFSTITLPSLLVLIAFLAAIKAMGLPYDPRMLFATLYPGLLAGLLGVWQSDIPRSPSNTEEDSSTSRESRD